VKVITRAQHIQTEVADYVARHAHVRGVGKIYRFRNGIALKARYDQMKAAGPIGEDQANELMGFVPYLECDECQSKPLEKALHLGDDPDYDMRWWVLCPACVHAALSAIEK
jgi:hypothetical protein